MSTEADANRLADDLESLRTGRLSKFEFRTKWNVAVGQELLRAIWPNLEHYLADHDVRQRDPADRAMQDTELQKFVRFLRAGAPAVELAKVTFLGYSR